MDGDTDGRQAARALALATLADPDFVYTLVQYWFANFENAVAPERQFPAFFVRLANAPIDLQVYSAMLVPSEHGALRTVPVSYVSFIGREDYAFSDDFLEQTKNAPALAALSLLLHPKHQAFRDTDTTTLLGTWHYRFFLYNDTLQRYARLDVMLMAAYVQFLRLLADLDIELAVAARLLSSLVSQLELRALSDPTQILAYGPTEESGDGESPILRKHRRACAHVCALVKQETHTLLQACARRAYTREMALETATRLWEPIRDEAREAHLLEEKLLASDIQLELL